MLGFSELTIYCRDKIDLIFHTNCRFLEKLPLYYTTFLNYISLAIYCDLTFAEYY